MTQWCGITMMIDNLWWYRGMFFMHHWWLILHWLNILLFLDSYHIKYSYCRLYILILYPVIVILILSVAAARARAVFGPGRHMTGNQSQVQVQKKWPGSGPDDLGRPRRKEAIGLERKMGTRICRGLRWPLYIFQEPMALLILERIVAGKNMLW